MLKKICPICGKTFETNRPNQLYCCSQCQRAGVRVRREKWYAENPHYYRDYMRKYRQRAENNAV